MATTILRDYQTVCVDQCMRVIVEGKSPLVVAPTGSGKTTIAGELVQRLEGRRVVWFAHRVELLDQARHHGAIMTTYQACAASGKAPDGDVAVFDEAHHLGRAGDWSRVVSAYPIRIGLTATPERADGMALSGFDTVVEAASYSALLEQGFLTPCKVMSPKKTLTNRQIVQRPVDAYLAHARGTKAICFAPTVKDCGDFVAQFREAGVIAETVHGEMSSMDRVKAIHRYKCGSTDVLCNVNILTEGWDAPITQTVILARSCGSAGLFIQMTGRALRLHHWKKEALLLDLSGAANVHGSPTEDRKYSLEGIGIQRAGVAMPAGGFCRVCGRPLPCQCVPADSSPMKVVGGELAPWQKLLRRDPPDQRVLRLSKWVKEARAKGHKESSAYFKYKGVYGNWPDGKTVTEARRLKA